MMKPKQLIILWMITILVVFFAIRFGLSDFMNTRHISYIETNPTRPFFRLIFGLIVTMIALISAGWITKRSLTQ